MTNVLAHTIQSADGSYIDDYYTSEIIDHDHPLNTSHASAFSPTFEPSPDNPLRTISSIERLRPRRSGDLRAAALAPLRMSDSVHTSFHEPPISPAPFSSMDPDPNPRPTPSPTKASHGIHRKPSVLRKNPTPPVSRQPSVGNLRQPQSGFGSGMRGNEYEYFSQGRIGSGGGAQGLGLPAQSNGYPPPTPGTTHHLQEVIYQNNQRDRTRRDAAQSQSQSPASPQAGEKRRGGCGCVVM